MTVKKKDIWLEIVSILNTAKTSGSLTYVKEILEGTREDIPLFPCILLEPKNDTEVGHTIPEFVRTIFNITITGWVQVYDKDLQITGEYVNPTPPPTIQSIGILDIERDIKNTLDLSQELNGKAIRISFPTTHYLWTFDQFPFRAVEIEMAIEFLSKHANR
jgi:hypothetical protein